MIPEAIIGEVVAGVVISFLVSGVSYIIHLNRKVLKRVEIHDRLFFGEDGVDTWKGVMKMLATLDESVTTDHRIILEICDILREHKMLDPSSPFYKYIYDDLKLNS